MKHILDDMTIEFSESATVTSEGKVLNAFQEATYAARCVLDDDRVVLVMLPRGSALRGRPESYVSRAAEAARNAASSTVLLVL